MKQEELPKEVLIPKVATLYSLGRSTQQIADALNISARSVGRIAKMDECKAIIKDIGDSATLAAKSVVRQQISKLVPLILEALESKLIEKDMQAVTTALKIIGALEPSEDSQAGSVQSLTVVMPGASVEKPAIEIVSEE